MTELPYMKLWVADHLSATAHLEPPEMGCYCRLLFIMWQQGGWLPNKPELLARYCRMTVKQWERVAPIVLSFFDEVELEVRVHHSEQAIDRGVECRARNFQKAQRGFKT